MPPLAEWSSRGIQYLDGLTRGALWPSSSAGLAHMSIRGTAAMLLAPQYIFIMGICKYSGVKEMFAELGHGAQ